MTFARLTQRRNGSHRWEVLQSAGPASHVRQSQDPPSQKIRGQRRRVLHRRGRSGGRNEDLHRGVRPDSSTSSRVAVNSIRARSSASSPGLEISTSSQAGCCTARSRFAAKASGARSPSTHS